MTTRAPRSQPEADKRIRQCELPIRVLRVLHALVALTDWQTVDGCTTQAWCSFDTLAAQMGYRGKDRHKNAKGAFELAEKDGLVRKVAIKCGSGGGVLLKIDWDQVEARRQDPSDHANRGRGAPDPPVANGGAAIPANGALRFPNGAPAPPNHKNHGSSAEQGSPREVGPESADPSDLMVAKLLKLGISSCQVAKELVSKCFALTRTLIEHPDSATYSSGSCPNPRRVLGDSNADWERALIAAAPELLDALISHARSGGVNNPPGLVRSILMGKTEVPPECREEVCRAAYSKGTALQLSRYLLLSESERATVQDRVRRRFPQWRSSLFDESDLAESGIRGAIAQCMCGDGERSDERAAS